MGGWLGSCTTFTSCTTSSTSSTPIDAGALTDNELHDLTISLQRAAARLTIAAAPVLSAWDDPHVWAGDGSKSPAHRLARQTNADPPAPPAATCAAPTGASTCP